MKCNNCGFKNEDNIRKCIKCNEELILSVNNKNSSFISDNKKTLLGQQSNGDFIDKSDNNVNNYSKTLLGEQAKESYIDRPISNMKGNDLKETGVNNCPSCGYQVMAIAKYCPNCNNEILTLNSPKAPATKVSQNFKGTIDPFSRKSFSLRPIVNGEPATASIEYAGDTELNRENTLKDNITITSKVQAEIKLDNGDWYLLDKSEKQTSFVRAGEPIKLKKGDIILLGDTKFIFE